MLSVSGLVVLALLAQHNTHLGLERLAVVAEDGERVRLGVAQPRRRRRRARLRCLHLSAELARLLFALETHQRQLLLQRALLLLATHQRALQSLQLLQPRRVQRLQVGALLRRCAQLAGLRRRDNTPFLLFTKKSIPSYGRERAGVPSR